MAIRPTRVKSFFNSATGSVGPTAHAETAIPQPPLLALRFPAVERQDQRALAADRIFIGVAPLVDDDFTLLDETAHKLWP